MGAAKHGRGADAAGARENSPGDREIAEEIERTPTMQRRGRAAHDYLQVLGSGMTHLPPTHFAGCMQCAPVSDVLQF